jgi:anti-anti-sigma factor
MSEGDKRGRTQCSPHLEVQRATVGARHTLVLSGELDLASAPALEATIERTARGGTRAITLDLSGLTFIDSCGLRSILLAKQLCEARSYDFVLVPGQAQVQRLFELTGLLDVLPFAAAA